MDKSLLNLQEHINKVVIDLATKEALEIAVPQIEKSIIDKFGFMPVKHEFFVDGKKTAEVKGVVHEQFDKVFKAVSKKIPVFLVGRAGTGKNVICKQVAEALGLDFYFTNAVTQEYKLTGFIDANGHYQETEFYKAFTKGGVFFLDEMDASLPEALLHLNAAISNGYFDFPNGKVYAHENFRVIAAGNTFGLGADNVYTGRYCLDRASLDRFVVIDIDYSPAIEKNVALNKEDLIDFCHLFREVVAEAGIDCLFSYRALRNIAELEEIMVDEGVAAILKMCLLKGMSEDDKNILKGKMKSNISKREKSKKEKMLRNKYVQAIVNERDFGEF